MEPLWSLSKLLQLKHYFSFQLVKTCLEKKGGREKQCFQGLCDFWEVNLKSPQWQTSHLGLSFHVSMCIEGRG